MRTPRDILVAGMGFLLGMMFCYLLLAPKPAPKPGNILMSQAQPTLVMATPRNTWPAAFGPGRYRQPVRIEPMYPADERDQLGAQPDLIDFNYVPDFQIDLD